MDSKDRIIIPIDNSGLYKAIKTVETLKPYVGMFKFGLEMITFIVTKIATTGDITLARKVKELFTLVEGQLFWDGKWADIPNTVGQAALAIQSLNPKLINIHASCGVTAIKEVVKNKGFSQVLGVTVLTSIDSEECVSIFGNKPGIKVVEFAKFLIDSGADGIICSPQELRLLEGFPLIKVTPGVRPVWASVNDQKRVMTPSEAVKAGADYLVIGRPITSPPNGITQLEAVKKIIEELEAV
ncbi:MAG: orotidine-5'-phosphate decarboxylase [Candidatus Shapirobacteria bacterium]|jgi:orotidine-5'-phosphate decarboxylase